MKLIAKTRDWRGAMLAKLRKIVHSFTSRPTLG